MTPPLLVIVGGSNGAGKSTFAVPYAARLGLPFLNADVLTREHAARGAARPLIGAAREFLRKLYAAIDARESVCFETTLSGGYVDAVVAHARAAGYCVELVFLFVDSPEVAIARVAGRVKKGGHHVPDEDVRRRFRRTLENFEALKSQVSTYRLYFSADHDVSLVRSFDGGKLHIFDAARSQHFDNLLTKP